MQLPLTTILAVVLGATSTAARNLRVELSMLMPIVQSQVVIVDNAGQNRVVGSWGIQYPNGCKSRDWVYEICVDKEKRRAHLRWGKGSTRYCFKQEGGLEHKGNWNSYYYKEVGCSW